jgi:hypothetical protein
MTITYFKTTSLQALFFRSQATLGLQPCVSNTTGTDQHLFSDTGAAAVKAPVRATTQKQAALMNCLSEALRTKQIQILTCKGGQARVGKYS